MDLSRACIVPEVKKSDLSRACSGLQVQEMVMSRAYMGWKVHKMDLSRAYMDYKVHKMAHGIYLCSSCAILVQFLYTKLVQTCAHLEMAAMAIVILLE